MLAAAATDWQQLQQNGSSCNRVLEATTKTSGQSRKKATGGEEKARSSIAAGVRYVGAGVDDVMRDSIGGGAGARCVSTNTNGRQMMYD